MKLGKHVSIAGGIDKAPVRAKNIGCNCLQIFSKNPRGWKSRYLSEEEARRVKDNIKELNMKPLVVHNTYLINLASPKDKLWHKSVKGLKEDYNRTSKIGGQYLVIHPGSHTGQGKDSGIIKISRALNKLLTDINSQVMVLLENVAGAGTSIGSNFTELYDIIKRIKQQHRIGICLDTCHAFAAGYDLTNKNGIDELLTRLDRKIGVDKLKLIHTNDSKYPLGSNKDEHAHIGDGFIGKKGFKNLINHSELEKLPFILETPQFEGKDLDVETILSLKD